MLDNITSAIFIVDKHITIKNVNDSFQTLFHKREDQILGELCGNAIGCGFQVDSGLNCGDTEHCQTCNLRNSLLFSFTEKVPTYNGKLTRYFYMNNQRVTKHFLYTSKYIDYHGEEMVLVIVDDITDIETHRLELKKTNEDLNLLNEQKNEFLGIAAHDLRNPIGAVRAFAEMMIHYPFTDEQKSNFLQKIYETSDFSLKLLNELLDISKIESGKLDLNKQETDYKAFLAETIELNQLYATKKKIDIKLDYTNSLEALYFDKDKLSQVINNFLSNAVKYSPEKTSIIVKVSQKDNQLLTEVIDQGQGIPPQEMDKLFEPFQTTSVKATAKEKSTGLGLAITKRIIEGHGGKVGVTSKPGLGSNFYFELPL